MFSGVLLCRFISKEGKQGHVTSAGQWKKKWEDLGQSGKACREIFLMIQFCFPYDSVLFSLAGNFCRLKVNIFSVRRPQDKVTAVLFNHPRALICMQHAAGSYRCSVCQWFCRNSYCENPVNWGKFLMTKAFPGHEALLPRGVLLSSTGLPSQAAFFHANKGD